ncbi:MAG: SxtJ family membrane protein [Pyrinomonadaceae bacterium]
MTDFAHQTPVTDRQARKTALVVACVLLALAAWNLYRGRTAYVMVLGGLGSLLLVVASPLLPAAVARRFHVLWMGAAALLGAINSRILLSLMFYLVFTPYGFISRLAGRDPLNRRTANGESYWTPRKKTRQTKQGFERLF